MGLSEAKKLLNKAKFKSKQNKFEEAQSIAYEALDLAENDEEAEEILAFVETLNQGSESPDKITNADLQRVQNKFYLTDLEFISNGSYGFVYSAKKVKNNAKVAVKIFKDCSGKTFDDSDKCKAIVKEFCYQDKFKDHNAVRVYKWNSFGPVIGFTMECMQGNLAQFKERDRFSEATAMDVLRSLVKTLFAMHQQNYVHRDIKPENILYSTEQTDSGEWQYVFKLGDFGIAKCVGQTITTSSTSLGSVFKGTLLFASPEQLLNEFKHARLSSKSDLFSLMVTVYYLLKGQHPCGEICRHNNIDQVLVSNLKNSSPSFEDIDNPQLRRLMQLALVFYPEHRISVEDVYLELYGQTIKTDSAVVEYSKWMHHFDISYIARELNEAIRQTYISRDSHQVNGQLTYTVQLKEVCESLLQEMLAKKDTRYFLFVVHKFIELNWCFRERVFEAFAFGIKEMAQAKLEQLPVPQIKDNTLKGINNAIHNIKDLTSQFSLPMFEGETKYDSMVQKLYALLDDAGSKNKILSKLEEFRADLASRGIGEMSVDPKNFVKSKASLLNKLRRSKRVKEDALREIVARDVVRVRVKVTEDKYVEAIEYFIQKLADLNLHFVRAKHTFRDKTPAPMVYLNLNFLPGYPALEVQIMHYPMVLISHFLYDFARCEFDSDIVEFVELQHRKIEASLDKIIDDPDSFYGEIDKPDNQSSDYNETKETERENKLKIEETQPDSDFDQNTGESNLDFDKYVKGDKLEIKKVKFEYGDCLALGKFLRTREDLEVIYLYWNEMLLEGLKPVADALKHLTRLRELEISANYFGPAGGRYLADSLASNMRLSKLNLISCDIGDEGLATLAPLLPRLSELWIGNNGITDGGLRYLERFSEDPVDKSRKRWLWLSRNQITDAGCETLADLFEGKRRIDKIEIGDNKVTQTGIDRLQKFIKEVDC